MRRTVPPCSSALFSRAAASPDAAPTDAHAAAPRAPTLTVLLPAYNEADRLLPTLQSYCAYLSASERWGTTGGHPGYEVLVVDDGSTDRTADLVRQFAAGDDARRRNVRVLSLERNVGKGSAIAGGCREILCSSSDTADGALVLVADADGSGAIECVEDMYEVLEAAAVASSSEESWWSGTAIVAGVRQISTPSLKRAILSWGFRTAVTTVCGGRRSLSGVSDTQCGFKLMTLPATSIYGQCRVRGWAHDVEFFYLATLQKACVSETSVQWTEREGSRLVESAGGVVGASLSMLWDVVMMRLAYLLGIWKVSMDNDWRAVSSNDN